LFYVVNPIGPTVFFDQRCFGVFKKLFSKVGAFAVFKKRFKELGVEKKLEN